MTPDAVRDLTVALLVVTVMLSVGFRLRPRDIVSVLSRPGAVGSGLLWEHVGVPALACLIVLVCGVPIQGALAVLICAAAPGGPVGPLFVAHARGDAAYAVSLVVLMAAINALSLPLTLNMVGWAGAEGTGIGWSLARTIVFYQVLPLFVAMRVGAGRPELAARLADVTERIGKVVIVGLVVGMGVTQWRHFLVIDPRTLFAIFCTCLASVLGGALVGRGSWPVRRARSVTSGVRNVGLALLVAVSAFEEETVVAVMSYGLVMLIVSGIAAHMMRGGSISSASSPSP